MADTNDMVNVTQREFQQFICQNTGSICEAKQGMIRENCPYSHGPGMENGLEAKTTETGMAMYNLYLLADNNIPEDGKKGEDGGKG